MRELSELGESKLGGGMGLEAADAGISWRFKEFLFL